MARIGCREAAGFTLYIVLAVLGASTHADTSVSVQPQTVFVGTVLVRTGTKSEITSQAIPDVCFGSEYGDLLEARGELNNSSTFPKLTLTSKFDPATRCVSLLLAPKSWVCAEVGQNCLASAPTIVVTPIYEMREVVYPVVATLPAYLGSNGGCPGPIQTNKPQVCEDPEWVFDIDDMRQASNTPELAGSYVYLQEGVPGTRCLAVHLVSYRQPIEKQTPLFPPYYACPEQALVSDFRVHQKRWRRAPSSASNAEKNGG